MIKQLKLEMLTFTTLLKALIHSKSEGNLKFFQEYWIYKVRALQRGGFCKGLELAQKGTVSNRATLSSLLQYTELFGFR